MKVKQGQEGAGQKHRANLTFLELTRLREEEGHMARNSGVDTNWSVYENMLGMNISLVTLLVAATLFTTGADQVADNTT